MNSRIIWPGLIGFVFSLSAHAGNVVSDVPSAPDPGGKYIFYLHGSMEESEGADGKYEAAVDAIASKSATVIAEVRGPTDPSTYAEKVKGQVNQLMEMGVPAKNITVSGFSKGSVIALAVSGAVQNPEVNYVLLAGCSDFLNDKYQVDASLASGRILSIYDKGDEKFGSCKSMIKESDSVKFKEKKLNTGKGHKLFKIPKEKFIKEWRDPLLKWSGA